MKTSNNFPVSRTSLILSSWLFSATVVLAQGSLTPPGAPSPTMKTLAQIEPRTPISSLPFTITNSGAYYVTTNLAGVSGANGITINTGNVTLDLTGFTLTGLTGTSNGIFVGAFTNITIRNGTLTGWTQMGIAADSSIGGTYDHVSVLQNGNDGMDPGSDAQLNHCVASENAANGFGGICFGCTFNKCVADANVFDGYSTYQTCIFADCSAEANVGDGFNPYFDCILRDCIATGNGDDGFNAPYVGCLFVHCVGDNNGGTGIDIGDVSTIRDSVAYDSGTDGIVTGSGCIVESCSSTLNQGMGILTSNECSVIKCGAVSNQVDGIVVSAYCHVKDCTAAYNDIGILATNDCSITDCMVDNNQANGIFANHSCVIENNTCQINGQGGAMDGGIRCSGSFNRIDGNHLTENNPNGLFLDGSGNTVVHNSAKSNSVNYSTGSGNDVGPIGSAATSTSPWANLQ